MSVKEPTGRSRGHSNDRHPFFRDGAKPRVLGHRGFVSEEMAAEGILDNTRAAFAAALAAGAEIIESDCHLTADGQPILFHDDDLMEPFGDARKVNEVSSAELSALMASRGGLISLEDALTDFPHAHFNIDVKSAEVSVPAGTIIGMIAPHRTLIASFSEDHRLRALTAATAAAAAVTKKADAETVGASGEAGVATVEVRLATSASQARIVRLLLALTLRSRRLVASALKGLDALQIPLKFGPIRVLTPRLIAAAHAHGVEVHVWTINDLKTMRQLASLGVDGIVTDRTDLAVTELHAD